MYKNKKISITVPVYNEEKNILKVLKEIPGYIDFIIIVDDASTDNTLHLVKNVNDPRLHIIQHKKNQGVGKSTIDGHNLAIKLGADILVRIDGDGQMDITKIPLLLEPLIKNPNLMYTKGNRMTRKELHSKMPFYRIIGNKILSFMTRITTGYRNLKDAQNGFTAIKKEAFINLRHDKLRSGYIFENSMLFELSLINAEIKEIEMEAIYDDETSYIRLRNFIPQMIVYQIYCIGYKIFRKFRKIIKKKPKK